MSRTLAQLREQTRVLLGDAADGSDRFTDAQILKALNWAQEQAARVLGLTYLERNIAVVDKVVTLPADVMTIPHVRLSTLLAVSYPAPIEGEVGALTVDMDPITVGVNPVMERSFAWAGAVAGLSLDAATGKITGAPSDAFAGNVAVTLTNDLRTAETDVPVAITKPAAGGTLEVYTISDSYGGSQGDSVPRMWTTIRPGYLAHWHYPNNPSRWSRAPVENQCYSHLQARGDYVYSGWDAGPVVVRHIYQDETYWDVGWLPWECVVAPQSILAKLTPIDASIALVDITIRSLRVDANLNCFMLLDLYRDSSTTHDVMAFWYDPETDGDGMRVKANLSAIPRPDCEAEYLSGSLLWWAGNRRTVPYFIVQSDTDGNHTLYHWLNCGTDDPDSIPIPATLPLASGSVTMNAERARAFWTGNAWYLGIADSTHLKWGNLFKLVDGAWAFQAHGAFPAAVLDDGNFLTTSNGVTDLMLVNFGESYTINNHPYGGEPYPQVESYVMSDGAIFRTGLPDNS